MNLRIELPPSLEQNLKMRAAETGQDLQSFVLAALSSLEPIKSEVAKLTSEEFGSRLDALAKLHLTAPASFDDSRESIYAGRGE